MNIGTDHENTTFFEYFGVTLKDDGSDYEVNTLKGTCAGCTELLKYYYLGGVSPHYKVDRLQPDGAMPLLNSEEGYGRMFVHDGAGYRAIASSVVVGAIANNDSLNIKPYFLSEFVNYFIGYNPVTALRDNLEQILAGFVYPNPFNDRTSIVFTLPERAHVSVGIYDMQGRRVKDLSDGVLQAGTHELRWDGTNDASAQADPGYYIATVRTPNAVSSKKIILLP